MKRNAPVQVRKPPYEAFAVTVPLRHRKTAGRFPAALVGSCPVGTTAQDRVQPRPASWAKHRGIFCDSTEDLDPKPWIIIRPQPFLYQGRKGHDGAGTVHTLHIIGVAVTFPPRRGIYKDV